MIGPVSSATSFLRSLLNLNHTLPAISQLAARACLRGREQWVCGLNATNPFLFFGSNRWCLVCALLLFVATCEIYHILFITTWRHSPWAWGRLVDVYDFCSPQLFFFSVQPHSTLLFLVGNDQNDSGIRRNGGIMEAQNLNGKRNFVVHAYVQSSGLCKRSWRKLGGVHSAVVAIGHHTLCCYSESLHFLLRAN